MSEVREYKYLEYTIKEHGGQEAHVKERRKRAAVMREVWGIGKKVWSKD